MTLDDRITYENDREPDYPPEMKDVYITEVYPVLMTLEWQGILFRNGMSVAKTARYTLKSQAERAVEVLREQWEQSSSREVILKEEE